MPPTDISRIPKSAADPIGNPAPVFGSPDTLPAGLVGTPGVVVVGGVDVGGGVDVVGGVDVDGGGDSVSPHPVTQKTLCLVSAP